MVKRTNHYHYAQILGLEWLPRNLVLVASSPGGGRMEYILGNCIIHGTSKNIPVGIFSGGISSPKMMCKLFRMQEEKEELPVYVDDTQELTISYLVNRILSWVEHQGIGMVVVNYLQKIDCSLMQDYSRERELENTLKILKSLAVAFDLVIIVSSLFSERYDISERRPTVADILDVTEPEKLFDQMVLIHPHNYNLGQYKLILPKGLALYDERYGETVINAVQNSDYHHFEKAAASFVDNDDDEGPGGEMPVNQWYKKGNDWYFQFLDATGMGWELSLERNSEHGWDLTLESWAAEARRLEADRLFMDDETELKKEALRLAGRAVPDVEIMEKAVSL